MVYLLTVLAVFFVSYFLCDGYIVYCPCMGRFGNQADHFLGALGFAKALNRTLVLPPWVEYRYGEQKSIQVPFDTYFEVEPLKDFHDVMTMEHFMKHFAPTVWPPNERKSFCYNPRGDNQNCNAKQGNPFGPFWDTFNIDFVGSEFYSPLHYDVYHHNMAKKWNERYPLAKYPVLAFTGAPATFPVQYENRHLHKYLCWNKNISEKAQEFVRNHLPRGGFIGIHLRNGVDWVRACEHVTVSPVLFSSPQCFGYKAEYGHVTQESCLPPKLLIVKQLKRVLRRAENITSIFVASDNDHMIPYLQEALKNSEVKVTKYPENNPHVDLAILGDANYFIGNCVSSFSAFVKRERDTKGLPTLFWGFPPFKKDQLHEEL